MNGVFIDIQIVGYLRGKGRFIQSEAKNELRRFELSRFSIPFSR